MATGTHDGKIAVRLTNVTKTFGSHKAVDGLSLEVPAGSVYGFIGPNGSGKTTTIRMILHIFHPDSGNIEVLGERNTRAANDSGVSSSSTGTVRCKMMGPWS